MMYNTQNYWGFWTLAIVQISKYKKTNYPFQLYHSSTLCMLFPVTPHELTLVSGVCIAAVM
jgi:hypothetical protein